MTRSKTSDLDRLAHGQAIGKEALLALLADPAQHDLARIARARDLLAPPDDEAPPAAMDVTWEELAAHAAGTLADSRRRHAVEEFLRREAPGLLPPVEETPTTVDLRSQETETRVDPPRPAKDPPPGDDAPGT